MNKKMLFISLFFLLIAGTNFNTTTDYLYDLTVVGSINFNASIGRQAVGIIDCLSDKLRIQHINTRGVALEDAPASILKILSNPPGQSPVAILEDPLIIGNNKLYKQVPNSTIKLAYTMLESTKIPLEWVDALNDYFDAAIVPDPFLVKVYKDSGVIIPIFVLPLGIYIEEFLAKPQKKQANKPFVFGCSTLYDSRKNHKLLLQSFIEEFPNNKNVVLKLHGRTGLRLYEDLRQIKDDCYIKNIRLTFGNLSWQEYIKFMTSLDCYISLSKGEGFGITPREAMAFGIPCILSNNTGHRTICNTQLVLSIKSTIPVEAFYPNLSKKPIGYYFTCRKQDVRNALRAMYNNYKFYLKKAHKGREWVQQYLYSNLQAKYLTLVKPHKVVLGEENRITDDCLITNNKSLYQKYLSIIS